MMKFDNEIGDIAVESFVCHFEPLTNYQWLGHMSKAGKEEHLTFALSLFDEDLLRRDFAEVPQIAPDLIELATIVYAVDRAVQPDEMSYCQIRVVMPVRCPELLSQKDIHDGLCDILHWYTGYEWHFDFIQRKKLGRDSENPQFFNWCDQSKPIDVALWSGGLDCLAGLYNRAIENRERQFVLCGTGASNIVYSLQKHIANLLPKNLIHRVKLQQVHYELKTISGLLPDNARMRSRGFTFMLIGSICAYLEGSHELQVYENGIGSINLRFRESEVGLNHAHSVHPFSLMAIATWLTQVLGEPFKLSNPYLFQTKSQMCQVFSSGEDLAVAFQTETCDRKHRKADAQQCGRCSSCILRRHAFAVLGIEDETPYVYASSNWLYEPTTFEIVDEGNHIPAVLYQVKNLHRHLHMANPWNSLVSQYETLAADIVDRTSSYYGLSEQHMREGLLRLYSQYVDEWISL